MVSAIIVNPLAGAFGAVGAAVLLLARFNHTVGRIIVLSMAVVRAFTFRQDDLIERLQALSIEMIRWRKI